MKVLVTGARGFVGRNLVESLKAIRDGKDRRAVYQTLLPLEVYELDLDSSMSEVMTWCAKCDFVVHLAGVNRPADGNFSGNEEALSTVLSFLDVMSNPCPILLSSSTQATLSGRFEGSVYGQSKLDAEDTLRGYADTHGAEALIYRFPNLYGKWCRPRYNSAVATFCDAIANDREYTVNDPSVELELLYVDDLVEEVLRAMLGRPHRCRWEGAKCIPDPEGDFCYVPTTDRVTLGQIVDKLQEFKAARGTLAVPDLTDGSFSKKLYSTYLSYLEPGTFAYQLKQNVDARGSFTEVLRTPDRGQVSVNVSKPGITKGQHWHHTKWERFLVVSGEALIQERRIGTDADGKPFPIDEYRVSGDVPTVVEMIPGYTHNIVNLSDTQDLVTLMWANEVFDPSHPDTFFEEV